MYKTFFLTTCFMSSISMAGTYNGDIKQVQSEGLDDPYNTIHLEMDVTDSPCSNSNDRDRFQIMNEIQHSAALAALIAGKEVEVNTNGRCNGGNIEEVNYITIRRSR